jgi:ubiquinone/menaquinone biosynthesis C-methylase UbiE
VAPLSRPDTGGGSGAESVSQQVAALAQRYSERADAYDRLWSPAIRPFGERLISALPLARAQQVIDVGTGAGALLPALQQAAPNATIVGVDNSEGMLRLARSRHAGPLQLMNVEELTFGDAWFDVAVAAFVLFHLPHPERCLAGVFRVLKPGGSVGTATWGRERFPPVDTIWDETLMQMGAKTARPPATENRACCDSESKVAALLEQAGFSASRVWGEPLVHRWDPALHFEHQVLATSRARLESLDADRRARCLEQLHARLQAATPHDYVYEGDVILATAAKP